jgi:hypothetical protein
VGGSSTSGQATTRSFSQVAIELPIWLIVVVVLVAMAKSSRGVAGAVVVGVVWGGYFVAGALLRERFVAWRQRHLLVYGSVLGLLMFVLTAVTLAEPFRSSLVAGLVSGFLIALVIRRAVRRAGDRTG